MTVIRIDFDFYYWFFLTCTKSRIADNLSFLVALNLPPEHQWQHSNIRNLHFTCPIHTLWPSLT
jgi:hypothetical protein